jgi:crotonobetainyl-CoA:carnitine CoA-transferase CaiB-like acyl-CoA transferase
VLDLKQPSARKVLWQLIETADVFAQNFRPGAVERLGFGAEQVMARNARVVYLSINGVGETGPYSGKRVYDPVVQALSGLADIQADPITGRPRMVRTLIADKTTAIYAAQAVTSALFARERRGQGQHVRLSMLDTMVAYLWPEGMAPFSIVADDVQHARATPHDMIFATADGFITLGAVSDREWEALCGALGRPEWIVDPRFTTGAARATNRQQRLQEVEHAMGGRSTAQMIETLSAADVPCAPVLTRRQMLDDPQVLANKLVTEVQQPGTGAMRQARPAARFATTPSLPPRPAPALGEHTEEILASLGLSDAQVHTLRSAQAII